jgi:Uma2 family endonuclease
MQDNSGMATVTMPLDANEQVWRMPVERYHAMIRSGFLTDDDHIELLEGVLVEKMSKTPGHRIATRRTCDALRNALPIGWYADEQSPITTPESEPEPDVSIVRGSTDQYADRHPGPDEVALVIEVADSSLARDRGIKKRIYARAGIEVYWLLDLNARKLEIYSAPRGEDYTSRQIVSEHESVSLVLDQQRVALIPLARFLPLRSN